MRSQVSVIRDVAVDSLASISVMSFLGIAIGIAALFTGVSAKVLRAGHYGAADPWILGAVAPMATDLVLFAVGLRRLKLNRDRCRPVVRLFERTALRTVLLGVIAGATLALVSVAYNTILRTVFGINTLPTLVEELRAARLNKPLLSAILFRTVLLAPVAEEFFFRASIFGSAWVGGRPWLGAVLGSVLFAMAHLAPSQFLFYFLFGMSMCWLFMRSRTLVVSVIAHITINFLACALALRVHGS